MQFNVSMFIWSFINFAVLAFFLRRFLWKPILGILETREREVAGNLDKAEQAREEAIGMKAEYEQRLAEAQRKAEEILSRANRKAEEIGNEIRVKAQAEAAQLLDRAREAIQREKEMAMAELRDHVADLALLVAGRVLERTVSEADHERLARQFVAEVGEAR